MKKFILLLGLIFFISCTADETSYNYTIVYKIDENECVYNGICNCPSDFVPIYICGENFINIGCVGHGIPVTHERIYYGKSSCRVVSFEYRPIRTYKVSTWDGHEIKRKNKG